MERSPEMQEFLDTFTNTAFGRTAKDGECVTCGSIKCEKEDFKDALSWKEYGVSHMCQRCQDDVFYFVKDNKI